MPVPDPLDVVRLQRELPDVVVEHHAACACGDAATLPRRVEHDTDLHLPAGIEGACAHVADDMRRVTNQEVVQYSAAGFRDFTRIAASDPTMWRDIFLSNKDAVLELLGRFTEELFMLQRAIRMGDGEMLHAYFTETRAIRRGIIEAGQDTDAPDFGRGGKT